MEAGTYTGTVKWWDFYIFTHLYAQNEFIESSQDEADQKQRHLLELIYGCPVKKHWRMSGRADKEEEMDFRAFQLLSCDIF